MRIAVWGDALGLPQSLSAMQYRTVAAVIGADNRPGDWTDLARLADAHGVPFLRQPFKKDAARRADFIAAIANVGADLFVVNSYSMILDADWLTIPRLGVINVHGALLPNYRGANVLNWVLINGEAETGVTVHWMDKGIDTGDILLQERVAIAADDTALTLRDKLSTPVPLLLREAIAKIASGSPPRIPQNNESARDIGPGAGPKTAASSGPGQRIGSTISFAPWSRHGLEPSSRRPVARRSSSTIGSRLRRSCLGESNGCERLPTRRGFTRSSKNGKPRCRTSAPRASASRRPDSPWMPQMSKTVAIHQPNFFPWLGYFDKLSRADVFVVLDHVQFPKKGGNWINRVRLSINGAPQWCTMPIRRDYHGVLPISEIMIDDRRSWRTSLLRSLHSSYRGAPGYSELLARLEELVSAPFEKLSEFNIHALRSLAPVLGIDPTKMVLSSTLSVTTSATDMLIDVTKKVGGSAYLCGGGSGDYLEPDKFRAAGIGLTFQNFEHPVYPQGNSAEFVAGLSVIDALMHCGAKTVADWLRRADESKSVTEAAA